MGIKHNNKKGVVIWIDELYAFGFYEITIRKLEKSFAIDDETHQKRR